jgi:hypothetical protein
MRVVFLCAHFLVLFLALFLMLTFSGWPHSDSNEEEAAW